MDWSTRVTRLLGCKYPIIGGSFGGFGTSAIAAPVSEAGGFGLITAGALRTPDRLRDDIRKARALTDKPFGVNFTVGMTPHIDAMVEVAIEEKVHAIETSAYKAEAIGRKVKQAGLVWFHKVATVEHALAAEKHGADAVVIVGLEGTGFKNATQLPTMIAIPWAARQMKIPLIAAGGVGDAHGFLASLFMGADAAYLGTVLMATRECPISQRYKELLVSQKPTDADVRDRALKPPSPEELQKVMKARETQPIEEWLLNLEGVLLKKSTDMPRTTTPDVDEAFRIAGGSLAVAFIDKVVTVKELIDGIISEAEAIVASRPFLTLR